MIENGGFAEASFFTPEPVIIFHDPVQLGMRVGIPANKYNDHGGQR